MQTTLRNRLILSHMLPLLIIIPLIGAALVYVLETEVFLPSLSRQLAGDAVILTELLKDQAEWWQEPETARERLAAMQPDLSKRIMLIAPDGRLLASSEASDLDRVNQILAVKSLENLPVSEMQVSTDYSQRLNGEVVDVVAPVTAAGSLQGYVRVTSRYVTISDELLQLRYLIGVVMSAGLLLGIVLGSSLAVNIGAPLQNVTQAVIALTHGERKEALPEYGPREIRQLIQAVNALVARLRSLEQSRRQLLANLVHELGRPLGALRMAVQVLLQGSKEDPAQLDELLQGMDQEMEGLQRLLNDLAHLHEQVFGPLELDLRPVQLSAWLTGTLRPWQEAARQKGLRWEEHVPADLPELRVDAARLSQIIGNLMSNAIKFTPAEGMVQFTAGAEADQVWLHVSDTGPGIPEEDREKIFTPFYRGEQRSRIAEGLGLGLAITQDLVKAHGGAITIESRPGEGSRFTVRFPR